MSNWFGSIWHGIATGIVGLLTVIGIGDPTIKAVNLPSAPEPTVVTVASTSEAAGQGTSTLSAIDELRAELAQENHRIERATRVDSARNWQAIYRRG